MEKKLIDAYDHMTMPDDCASRIENRLQAELQNRKPGQYTKTVAPYSNRRGGWAAVAACLLLVLVMGGTAVLFLNQFVFQNPTNLYVDMTTEEMAQSTTPKEYYRSVTSLSAEEVENFAKVVRNLILTENWKALSGKVQYPIAIEQQEIRNEEAFVAFMEDISLGSHFLLSLKYESCAAMWFDDTGIFMGDGQICISEAQRRQLKITSISRLTETAEDMVHFTITRYPEGKVAIHQYRGYEETVIVPEILGNSIITQVGTGYPVIANRDVVRTVIIPDSVIIVEDKAFANCPALEEVFFAGDAPPEAECVFEGSENVTVYYQKDTKGWGDTWCGRKTMEYDGGYISLGTVTVQDRVPVIFQTVLSGEPAVVYGSREKLTAQECCMEIWGDATANAFTLADMDRDGICELIFSVQDADGVLLGYLVVRQDGAGIYGYTLRGRDLRKDGTYYSYTAKENSRLRFQDEISFFVESADFSQQDKPLAQWHVYPCQYPQLVLEPYRYASETGFSTHPGIVLYSYFGTLLSKEADWSSVQPWLAGQSVYVEEKGSFYAFDPDAPGCMMYGTLLGTGEQQKLTALGYYICDETGEYRAEVFDLETSNPIYTVDPSPNDRGREVGSVEAMQDYFGVDFYGSDVSQDVQQIAELLDKFVYRYSVHDTKGMGECMAEDAWELSSYPFTGEVSILSYGIFPDAAVNVGESWHTSVELLESGDTKTCYHLSVALEKQPDGWKIHSYSLEEQ